MRFSQADSASSHAGTPWCCQPEKKYHDIIISSFCNIVKGQAKCMETIITYFLEILMFVTFLMAS